MKQIRSSCQSRTDKKTYHSELYSIPAKGIPLEAQNAVQACWDMVEEVNEAPVRARALTASAMQPTALNPGERVDCFPLGVALALEEDEVELDELVLTTVDVAALEGATLEEAAELEEATELEATTDFGEEAELEEATELEEAAELEDATELDDVTEEDAALALDDATELDEATDEDATAGAGNRSPLRNKVKVELPPQFSVYWESEQAMEHLVLSKSVVLEAPLAMAMPQ